MGEVRDKGYVDVGLKRRNGCGCSVLKELRVKIYLESSVGPKKLEVFCLIATVSESSCGYGYKVWRHARI